MTLRHHLNVCRFAVALGFRQALADKIDLLGTSLIYITIIILYSGVIRLMPAADIASFGFTHAEMIWYLSMTEFVLFSCSSWGFKELQNEHLSGEIQLSLLRPYPDSLLRVAMWSGGAILRVLGLLPVFLITATLASGTFVPTPAHFLGLLFSLPLATLILIIGVYFVGSSCLWFVQAEPAYWIWLKSHFLFGALLWPMALYPVMMQNILWITPFPAVLAFAGSWALSLGWLSYALHFIHQIFWAGFFLLALRKLDVVILKHIQKGGS